MSDVDFFLSTALHRRPDEIWDMPLNGSENFCSRSLNCQEGSCQLWIVLSSGYIGKPYFYEIFQLTMPKPSEWNV